tara:strand:+ start:98 stop:592 length:495 start_codon:yes stop_codon:yes gene_type:complete
MTESFKFFTESSNKAIEDLKKMIQNPDPERVKMYGGNRYVDMLKLKLNRMLKVEALKDHLRKSKMSGHYKHDSEDSESNENLFKKDYPAMLKNKNKNVADQLSPGVKNTLSNIFDKILRDKGVKQEDAEDRCKRKADSVYGKKTSAYKSGAIVRCRKGKIWKKK